MRGEDSIPRPYSFVAGPRTELPNDTNDTNLLRASGALRAQVQESVLVGLEERSVRVEQIRVIRIIRVIRQFRQCVAQPTEPHHSFGLAARSRSSARSPAPLVTESSA